MKSEWFITSIFIVQMILFGLPKISVHRKFLCQLWCSSAFSILYLFFFSELHHDDQIQKYGVTIDKA